VVRRLHEAGIAAEVLVPDFAGNRMALATVAAAVPEVLNHNIETVPRLYREVRPGADYARSLALLAQAKDLRGGMVTKSGLMLGLGETREELLAAMADLRRAGVDLLTLGQYLQPSAAHHPVARYVPPEEFAEYEPIGLAMGFAAVAAAPPVRSSFRAEELYQKAIKVLR
jgi:lipoic acid synthetase